MANLGDMFLVFGENLRWECSSVRGEGEAEWDSNLKAEEICSSCISHSSICSSLSTLRGVFLYSFSDFPNAGRSFSFGGRPKSMQFKFRCRSLVLLALFRLLCVCVCAERKWIFCTWLNFCCLLWRVMQSAIFIPTPTRVSLLAHSHSRSTILDSFLADSAQGLHLTQRSWQEGRKCHVDAKTGLAYITTTLTTTFSFRRGTREAVAGWRAGGWDAGPPRSLHASPLIGHNYWI